MRGVLLIDSGGQTVKDSDGQREQGYYYSIK